MIREELESPRQLYIRLIVQTMDLHPGLLNTTTIVCDLGVPTSFPFIYLSSILLVIAFVFRVVLYVKDIESEDTFHAVY